MHPHLDHRLRDAQPTGALSGAVPQNLGQNERLPQRCRQAGEETSRVDGVPWILLAGCGLLNFVHRGSLPRLTPKHIDGPIPDDGKQPRPEGSARIVRMPGFMKCQQGLLNAVVEHVEHAEPADQVGPDDTRELFQELPVRLPVAFLGAPQPLGPARFIRCSICQLASGEPALARHVSLPYTSDLDTGDRVPPVIALWPEHLTGRCLGQTVEAVADVHETLVAVVGPG